MGCDDIYTNTTKNHIFITTEWHEDPQGGRAIIDNHYCVGAGESIDVEILGLKKLRRKLKIENTKQKERTHDREHNDTAKEGDNGECTNSRKTTRD